ncbi:hypothetical protein [Schleiferilactobacillus perolens]|uniref:hypothetical protein n=1 Tax=Schleiferilactobacillus perolens TaxID=100468 RepID=UPI0039E7E695
MWQKFKSNPIHVAIGLSLIGIGAFLIGHDEYFKWPPGSWILFWANDDVTGAIFIAVGGMFLWWVVRGKQSAVFNRNIIIAATFLFGMLSVYQFFHWVGLGWDSLPWISNGLNTAFVIYLARKSDTEDHGGEKGE